MALLPNETLAEFIAFLKLFDLSAPLLTSRRFSLQAAIAVRRIPVFYTHKIILRHSLHPLYYLNMEEGQGSVLDEGILVPAELLPIALSNCVTSKLYLCCLDHPSGCVACAVRDEAARFAVTTISLSSECFADIDDLLGFLAAFRNLEVRALSVYLVSHTGPTR